MSRKKLTETDRKAIYQKTNGHCAYCGSVLPYKSMQADHIVPLRRGGEDTLDNMLPACRSCNHYKSSMDLEGFRKSLEAMPVKLARDSVTYKIAVRFGLIVPAPHHIKFYFESLEEAKDE